MVQSALACGDEAESVRREVAARRAAVVVALRERFARAVAEGDLPARPSPPRARHVASVNHRTAVQAADGASREELEQVAEMALRTWHGELHRRWQEPVRPRRRSERACVPRREDRARQG